MGLAGDDPDVESRSGRWKKLNRLGLALDEGRQEGGASAGGTWQPLRGVFSGGVRLRIKGEDERPFNLGPLDVSDSFGELVFHHRGNGSGKSTLVKVLTGCICRNRAR